MSSISPLSSSSSSSSSGITPQEAIDMVNSINVDDIADIDMAKRVLLAAGAPTAFKQLPPEFQRRVDKFHSSISGTANAGPAVTEAIRNRVDQRVLELNMIDQMAAQAVNSVDLQGVGDVDVAIKVLKSIHSNEDHGNLGEDLHGRVDDLRKHYQDPKAITQGTGNQARFRFSTQTAVAKRVDELNTFKGRTIQNVNDILDSADISNTDDAKKFVEELRSLIDSEGDHDVDERFSDDISYLNDLFIYPQDWTGTDNDTQNDRFKSVVRNRIESFIQKLSDPTECAAHIAAVQKRKEASAKTAAKMQEAMQRAKETEWTTPQQNEVRPEQDSARARDVDNRLLETRARDLHNRFLELLNTYNADAHNRVQEMLNTLQESRIGDRDDGRDALRGFEFSPLPNEFPNLQNMLGAPSGELELRAFPALEPIQIPDLAHLPTGIGNVHVLPQLNLSQNQGQATDGIPSDIDFIEGFLADNPGDPSLSAGAERLHESDTRPTANPWLPPLSQLSWVNLEPLNLGNLPAEIGNLHLLSQLDLSRIYIPINNQDQNQGNPNVNESEFRFGYNTFDGDDQPDSNSNDNTNQ